MRESTVTSENPNESAPLEMEFLDFKIQWARTHCFMHGCQISLVGLTENRSLPKNHTKRNIANPSSFNSFTVLTPQIQ